MEDEPLIRQLLAGHREAVDEVRSWARAACRPYERRLAAELDDILQEALLDLICLLREGRFEGRSSLKTFVRRLVHYKCIDRVRSLGRRQMVAIEDLDLPSPAPSALQRMSAAEDRELALRVVEKMSEACRQLWAMIQEGRSYREMSKVLGVAEGALRARVLRCRRRARKVRDRIRGDEKA